MNKELFFLRSSEQNIVKSMYKYAYKNESNFNKLTDFYGLSTKDLGLYALVDNKIAGAIWSRELDEYDAPLLSVAVVDEFKGEGVGAFMMEQFLQEAASRYEKLLIDISHKPKALSFYKKFGFVQENGSLLLSKILEKKEVVRPSDGYDPTKWMD